MSDRRLQFKNDLSEKVSTTFSNFGNTGAF